MAYAVAFDFEKKHEDRIDLHEVAKAREAGKYCWIHFDSTETDEALVLLADLKIEAEAIKRTFQEQDRFLFELYKSCVLFSLLEVSGRVGSRTSVVRVLLGDGFMISIASKHVEFMRRVRERYRESFQSAALSPGYLLFELSNHLAHVYQETLHSFSEQIEQLEDRLFVETESDLFLEASELIRGLLAFRKTVVASREIIHELATRRSPYISETTQPYLEKHASLLERLSQDATTEREVLSEFLNLYMGMVAYRTNRVVTRLTIISTIFLPLTFFVGVYGMNFRNMPELGLRYGYLFFWIFTLGLVAVMLLVLRRLKWQ